MATKTKPNKAEFMKTVTPAEGAKVLGHEDGGKKLRARLRSIAGKQADVPNRWNKANKDKLWAIFVEGKQAAKTRKQTSGGNAKQRRTRKRAEKAEAATSTE